MYADHWNESVYYIMHCMLIVFLVDTLVAAPDEEVMLSGPETVHTEAETDGTAHELVHTETELPPCETQCHQLDASSSEVIVDSDSVYSVCCSDVTTDTADIVHVDNDTAPTPAHGTADHPSCHLSLCLQHTLHYITMH